jgi:hypothetical protein
MVQGASPHGFLGLGKVIPAGGAGVFKGLADDILKASIHGAMRPWYGAKEKSSVTEDRRSITGLIKRLLEGCSDG